MWVEQSDRVSKCSVISRLPLHSDFSISLKQTWPEQTKNFQKYSIRSENEYVKYQSFLKLFDNERYLSRRNKRLIKSFLRRQRDTNVSTAYHRPLFKCQIKTNMLFILTSASSSYYVATSVTLSSSVFLLTVKKQATTLFKINVFVFYFHLPSL